MTQPAPRKSDLGVRAVSAVVMIVVAGAALWLGGAAWMLFVTAIAFGVLWEWWGLVRGFVPSQAGRIMWVVGGLAYIGLAAGMIILLRGTQDREWLMLLIVLLGVIGTDVGAYFSGRTFGGPKIAPRISPSKTWAGLIGGMVAAGAVIFLVQWLWHSGLCDAFVRPFQDPTRSRFQFDGPCSLSLPPTQYLLSSSVITGAILAAVAQSGDFFESWMKRRAGVKDSGNFLPGHGGLFDRLDGLLAVSFVFALTQLAAIAAFITSRM